MLCALAVDKAESLFFKQLIGLGGGQGGESLARKRVAHWAALGALLLLHMCMASKAAAPPTISCENLALCSSPYSDVLYTSSRADLASSEHCYKL